MSILFGLILLTLVAATIGTLTGFGTSTIMVPILSFFLPLPQTLLFVGVIHWFGDIWKIIFFKKGLNWQLILMFGLPGIVVSFLAARVPLTLPQSQLKHFLGLFLVIYVIYLLANLDWQIPAKPISAVLGGGLSGFFAAIFGVGGAIRSTFLSAFNLKKQVFLFTSGVIGLIIDSGRLSQYLLGGIRLGVNVSWTLFLCIPASLLGGYVAKKFIDQIPQASFRLVIALALFLVGWLYLIWG